MGFIRIFRFLIGLVDLAVESDDGRISSSDISALVESELRGFHSYALPICYKQNADPRSAMFPLESLMVNLSKAKKLDFPRLWAILSESPNLDRMAVERMAVYDLTSDPHPALIFNMQSSTWFRNLLSEKIDVDRYHCSYIGSYHFAEVSLFCLNLILDPTFEIINLI